MSKNPGRISYYNYIDESDQLILDCKGMKARLSIAVRDRIAHSSSSSSSYPWTLERNKERALSSLGERFPAACEADTSTLGTKFNFN